MLFFTVVTAIFVNMKVLASYTIPDIPAVSWHVEALSYSRVAVL